MTLHLKRRGYSDCLQRPKYMLYTQKKKKTHFKYEDGKANEQNN